MIEISQEEFEMKIREVIKGKKSKSQLIKELKTDSRTLNNKIQKMSLYNRELYNELIKVKPFRAKTRNDIDYEALVIEMLKKCTYTIDVARKYRIGVRTIQRGVKKLEKENPDLIELYKAVKKANKTNSTVPIEIQYKIDELIARPVKIAEINETRKKELENIEKIFNERLETYKTKESAAQSMGLTANRVYKLLNELSRIKVEEEAKSFRDKVKVVPNANNAPINNSVEQEEPSMEGVEK